MSRLKFVGPKKIFAVSFPSPPPPSGGDAPTKFLKFVSVGYRWLKAIVLYINERNLKLVWLAFFKFRFNMSKHKNNKLKEALAYNVCISVKASCLYQKKKVYKYSLQCWDKIYLEHKMRERKNSSTAWNKSKLSAESNVTKHFGRPDCLLHTPNLIISVDQIQRFIPLLNLALWTPITLGV